MVTITERQRTRLLQLDAQLDHEWNEMCKLFQAELDRRDAECEAIEQTGDEEMYHKVVMLHEEAAAHATRAYFAAHWALHSIDIEDPQGYRRYRALFLAERFAWRTELVDRAHKERVDSIDEHFAAACRLFRKLQRGLQAVEADDQLTVVNDESVALLTGHMQERGVIGDSNLRQLPARMWRLQLEE